MPAPSSRPSEAEDSGSPTESLRTEDILLERLKNEPPVKQQVPLPTTILVIIGVLAVSVGVYFVFQKPDKYAEDPHAKARQTEDGGDSSEIQARRLKFGPYVDSLQKAVAANPDDMDSHLHYANALYETAYWSESKREYEIYLKARPRDTDARVDYSFVVTQATHDFKQAIAEIEKALAIDPDHIKGLFNAGLLAVQAYSTKEEGIAKSEYYFKRAKGAAIKKHETEMLSNIEQILTELDKMKHAKEEEPAEH